MNVKTGIVAEMGGPGKVLLVGKVTSSTAKQRQFHPGMNMHNVELL